MEKQTNDRRDTSNGWARTLVAPTLLSITAFISGCSRSDEIDGPVKIHPAYVSSNSSVGSIDQSSTIQLYLENTRQNLAIELHYEITDRDKLYRAMPESIRNRIDERNQYLRQLAELLQPGQSLEAKTESQLAISKSLQEVIENTRQQNANEQRHELDRQISEALRQQASKFFELHGSGTISGRTISIEMPRFLDPQISNIFRDNGVSVKIISAGLKDRD